MPDPVSVGIIVSLVVRAAPSWLATLRDTLLDKGKEMLVDKGLEASRDMLHLDDKQRQNHLEQVLKKTAERGLAHFTALVERDQYRSILEVLCEPGPHSEALRREVLCLFSLSDTPDLQLLNDLYNRSLQTRVLSQSTPPPAIDAAPYLLSFFNALTIELYADPYFKAQMSDVLRLRAAVTTQNALVALQSTLGDVATTLNHIDEKVADEYSAEQLTWDIQVYIAYLKKAFRYLKIVGVVPKDQNKDPELAGIFVPLRIKLQNQADPQTKKLTWLAEVLEQYPCTVLLGGPGSGKSTATRYLTWSHAMAQQADVSSSAAPLLSGCPLPLRIELRRLTEERKNHNYNFLSYASEVMLGREGIEVSPQMFKVLLARGQMLLLFDGLDEVVTLEERRMLVEEIERFAQNYPGNRILVTSRPVGYELSPCSSQLFVHGELEEFDNHQILQFLERWYMHVLQLSPIPYQEQQELDEFYKTLKENPRLRHLAANPLLLTVITALHRYERLPDRRVLIYDRCANLLLETWAKLKGTNVRWKDMRMVREDQYACVAHLGFVLHQRSQEQAASGAGATDVPARFMLRQVEQFLQERGLISERTEQRAEARRFLDLVQIEAGLIVERGKDESGEDLYGFVHRTFQEYFAAADVYERYQQEEDPSIIRDFIVEHLHDPHWHEVILLLLGKLRGKPATKLLRQILEGKLVSLRSKYNEICQQDLSFVCECLTEDITADHDLVEMVMQRLHRLVMESPFPSQQLSVISTLADLLRAKQHVERVSRELTDLLAQQDLDLDLRIASAQALYNNSAAGSPEHAHYRQSLLTLIPPTIDRAIGPMLSVARTLQRSESSLSPEQKQMFHVLVTLKQQQELSHEQELDILQALYMCTFFGSDERQQAIQMFMHYMRRTDLSLEQQVKAVSVLYIYGSGGATFNVRSFMQDLVSGLLQRNDLTIVQRVDVIVALYRVSADRVEEQQLFQMLVPMAQEEQLSEDEHVRVLRGLFFTSRAKTQEHLQACLIYLQALERIDVTRYGKASLLLHNFRLYPEEAKKAFAFFLRAVFCKDLPLEERLAVASNVLSLADSVRLDYEPIYQWLLALLQDPSTSIEYQVRLVSIFQSYGLYLSDDARQVPVNKALQLLNGSELTVKQRLGCIQGLFTLSLPLSEPEQQAWQYAQQVLLLPELTVDEQLQLAGLMYQFDSLLITQENQSLKILQPLLLRTDLTVEESIQLAYLINNVGKLSQDRHVGVRMLGQYLLREDITYAQKRQILQTSSSYNYLYEDVRIIDRILLQFMQDPGLTLEEQLLLVIAAKQYTINRRLSPGKEKQRIVQILLQLIQRADLAFEETLLAAEALFWVSVPASDPEALALEAMAQCMRKPELAFEEMLFVWRTTRDIEESSLSEKPLAEERAIVRQRLLALASSATVPFEQQIVAVRRLLRSPLPLPGTQSQPLIQRCWQLAEDQTLALEQRLQALSVLLGSRIPCTNKLRALQMAQSLLSNDALPAYLKQYWSGAYTLHADISDLSFILECLNARTLPSEVCNSLYGMLEDIVPYLHLVE